VSDQITLDQARDQVRAQWETGSDCPCCGQRVQLYRRKLNSSMAYALLLVVRDTTGDWLHVPTHKDLARLGGDFAKLRFWRLIEERSETNDASGGPHAGYWRVTFRGRLFARGCIAVPRYVFVYNKRVRRVGDKLTTITDALGDRFSYPELMGHPPAELDRDQQQLSLAM